ncbi:MAG: hypothetical protein Q9174_006670, partial [Haloplaca sp. 1 TL-2023]
TPSAISDSAYLTKRTSKRKARQDKSRQPSASPNGHTSTPSAPHTTKKQRASEELISTAFETDNHTNCSHADTERASSPSIDLETAFETDNHTNRSHADTERASSPFIDLETIGAPPMPNRERSPPPRPQSTLAWAISSLAADEWLSTTAVDLLVRLIPGEDTRIYDASFMRVDQPMSMQKQPNRSWPTVLGILPTIHQNNHWTLLVVDAAHNQVEFYNSLPSKAYESEAEAAVKSWASVANVDRPEFRFQTQECCVQPNSSDCGIMVLINAMQRILRLAVPSPIDLTLWRKIFHAVLSNLATSTSTVHAPTEEPVPLPTVPPLNISPTVELFAEVPDDEASLRADFEHEEELLKKARGKQRLATQAARFLQLLLSENKQCLQTSEARRVGHQGALRGYQGMLATFQTLYAQHTEVGIALESSIDKEARELRRQEERCQHLERAQGGWEAGLRVCKREEMIQRQHGQAARALMEDLVERLQGVQQRLAEMAVSAEKLKFEWEQKLRTSYSG